MKFLQKKFVVVSVVIALFFVIAAHQAFAFTPANPVPAPTGGVVQTGSEATEPTASAADQISCMTWLGPDVMGCIAWIIGRIFEFLNYLIGTAITFVASVVNGILKFTSFANNDAIVTGWTIMRDFANMFFILVMVFVSIATILRIQQYNAQRMLFWIIFIAILVNFSRVIAFIVIDFSHVFANAFLNAFPNNDIAGALSEGLLLNKLNPDTNNQSPLIQKAQGVDSPWLIVASIVFNTVILTMILAALAIAAMVFVVRIIILWFLILVAPLAFIGRLLPGLKGQTWDRWWSSLFKWSFVAPIYLFFIYMTVQIINNGGLLGAIQNIGSTTANVAGLPPPTEPIFLTGATWGLLLIMIIIAGFLIGGLKLALGMAGTFGAGALTLGKRAAGAVGGGAAFLGRKGVAVAGRRAQESYQKQVDAGRAPTGVRALAYGAAARLSAGAQQRDREAIEGRKKDLEKRYGDNKLALQTRLLTAATPGERAAIIARLDEMPGGLVSDNDLIKQRLSSASATAARLGFRPKSRPDLAAEGKVGTAATEAIEKAVASIKPKDVENLTNHSIDETKVGLGRANDTMGAMLKKFGPAVVNKIMTENDEFAKQFHKMMEDFATTLGGGAGKLSFDAFTSEVEKTYKNPALGKWLRENPAARTRFSWT
ncbi:hypothetical protein C4553_03210 [Candidatus Parcubacteria bacterium]|nr:MAG: hypothetical protein C4553_03210 [Candidatus Parcubacteria bacterium]